MELKDSKFNIGEKVYIYQDKRLISVYIRRIRVLICGNMQEKKYYFEYDFDNNNEGFMSEDCFFKTKDDFVRSLLEDEQT